LGLVKTLCTKNIVFLLCIACPGKHSYRSIYADTVDETLDIVLEGYIMCVCA